jgi:hypothetical protein
VLPLPKAVADYLADFVPPDGPPEHDPLELMTAPIAPRDRIEAQWLLDAPRRPGGESLVLDPLWVDGRPLAPFPHQARVDRRAEVAAVQRPWDILIVDEAHAARRKVFHKNEPNQLLGLLEGLAQRRVFRSLWLLTATPMQLEPREVYDLLVLCGLGEPGWGDWRTLDGFEGFSSGSQPSPAPRPCARASSP